MYNNQLVVSTVLKSVHKTAAWVISGETGAPGLMVSWFSFLVV